VLDVGCGPGVVLEWLEKKGIESFGVDSSPGVIALQKHQNRSNVILGSLKNLEELFLGFYFKGIVLLGNNLGLAGDFEQSRVFFEQCYRMLPHGGRLVGSSIDPSQTSSEINIQYQNRNRLEGKYYGQIRIHLEYQTRTSPEWDLVLFEPKDCSELLQSVGFKCVEILPDGSSYVLIAEK
jgi:SAM-dependent methyltransferase